MSSLYLGIRLPEKPYERLKVDDLNLSTKNIVDLKVDVEKMLNFSHSELEFIYCGIVLHDDNQSLEQCGVRANSTIHVYRKQTQVEYTSEPATEEQIQKASMNYRLVFQELAGSSLAKAIRPEVLRKVLEAYPEFHTNLGAYAILRDAILIGPMSVVESAQQIAKLYPIIVHSAEFVTKTIREHLASNKPSLIQNALPSEDSLSDSSSSEGDSPMASPNQQPGGSGLLGDIRQISRDQLAAALMMAGTSSRNSLSNIASQRAFPGTPASGTGATGQSAPTVVPSTSASSASGSGAGQITSSLFTNALSQALLAQLAGGTGATAAGAAGNASGISGPAQPTSNENLAERYASELQTMREIGLFDEMANIQALVVSNGDVEAAINLVLSGLAHFN